MGEFKVIQLWPKSVFVNNIGVKQEWFEFAKTVDYDRMPNNTGDYTKHNILESEHLKDLKKEIEFQFNLYATKYLKIDTSRIEFYITTSWINRHHKGDEGDNHYHINSLFSGVYYIDAENKGGISFENTGISDVRFQLPITECNTVNSGNYGLTPKNGDLIIFPSSLMHKIEKNNSDYFRYSLAFNIFFKGKLSGAESYLEIK
jgi:uncharacterized protein (TIGR02466 family)